MSLAAAIIPARGGSRRIPGKNIRSFHGKPILAYAIDTAIRSGLFECGVWVSTDDPAIAKVAWDAGAKVHPRQKDLAEDGIGTQQVVRKVADELWPNGYNPQPGGPPEALCCIYPCTPLMKVGDLRVGYGMLRAGITPYVYSVGPDGKDAGAWYWGLFHAFDTIALEPATSQAYRLPAERTCDVNTFEDWERAHHLYANMTGRKP